MKYVHLECLQQWVHNKRHTKELEKVKSYNWKFLECELCKHKIHEEFEFKGRKYYLLQYERPTSGKYLILESLTNTPHKTIHVIQIPERLVKPNKSVLVKVGREEKVDVRITDVSVSKYHCKIFYYNGEFYCIDKNSKFGTTVLLRNPISIPQREDNMIRLQVGKHLIELESQSHIDMCFRNSTCRINKNFKGTEYKDFKQVIPRDMRLKLDMLQNVTNIIETLNVEEAEDCLNREMTKLKLVNESQISQRHLTIENGISIEECDKEYQNFVLTRKQNQQTTPISYVEQNNPYSSNSPRNSIHKDISLQISRDIVLNMQLGASSEMQDSFSRNNVKNKLNMHNSTRERLDPQDSQGSIGQFTFSNVPNSLNPEGISKINKFNSSLFADYRKRSVIEEEKSNEIDPSSIRPRKIRLNISDEEEKKNSISIIKTISPSSRISRKENSKDKSSVKNTDESNRQSIVRNKMSEEENYNNPLSNRSERQRYGDVYLENVGESQNSILNMENKD